MRLDQQDRCPISMISVAIMVRNIVLHAVTHPSYRRVSFSSITLSTNSQPRTASHRSPAPAVRSAVTKRISAWQQADVSIWVVVEQGQDFGLPDHAVDPIEALEGQILSQFLRENGPGRFFRDSGRKRGWASSQAGRKHFSGVVPNWHSSIPVKSREWCGGRGVWNLRMDRRGWSCTFL